MSDAIDELVEAAQGIRQRLEMKTVYIDEEGDEWAAYQLHPLDGTTKDTNTAVRRFLVALANLEAAIQQEDGRIALLEAKCAQWWLLVEDAIISEPEWFELLLSAYANTSDPLTDQARALGEAATAARAEHTVCPTCGCDNSVNSDGVRWCTDPFHNVGSVK